MFDQNPRQFVRGRNVVLKIETAGPMDTVLAFAIERCDEDVLLEILRTVGKATLRNLGFKRIGCIDLAEKHAFLSTE